MVTDDEVPYVVAWEYAREDTAFASAFEAWLNAKIDGKPIREHLRSAHEPCELFLSPAIEDTWRAQFRPRHNVNDLLMSIVLYCGFSEFPLSWYHNKRRLISEKPTVFSLSPISADEATDRWLPKLLPGMMRRGGHYLAYIDFRQGKLSQIQKLAATIIAQEYKKYGVKKQPGKTAVHREHLKHLAALRLSRLYDPEAAPDRFKKAFTKSNCLREQLREYSKLTTPEGVMVHEALPIFAHSSGWIRAVKNAQALRLGFNPTVFLPVPR